MRLHSEIEVRRNSKTKHYTDGTQNTISCRQAIFKDPFDVSLEALANQDEKFRIASEHSQNIIDFLHEHDISYEDYHREELDRKREKREERAEARKNQPFSYGLN